MNRAVIRYISGVVLSIEAILLLFPALTGLIYHEKAGWVYLITAVLCIACGFLLARRKPGSFVFYLKEGCIATAFSWIFMSIFGALPLWLSGEIPCYTDALFEIVSGFTTTGASILSDVEALSYCNLFWRSFTHWIGGMGVLVFLLAIIPLSGASSINLMRAESPGPSVGKLVPKLRYTARILYLIYLCMTIIQLVLLLAGGMSFFDAICTSFATAGTGGFGIKNDSLGSYSPYIQWVTAIFMLLFGINFNAFYLILFHKWKQAFKMEEVRAYILVIMASTGIIFLNILNVFYKTGDALRHSFFQVTSIISSTGFSTADFDQWPQVSRVTLVLIMFIGACAGSTGGGIKVSRIIILVKAVFKELSSYIHPKIIKKIKIDGKPVEHEIVRSVNAYFITFIIVFSISVFIVTLEDKDLVTNFTAVVATLNNIGPGLGLAGPAQNFGHFSMLSKYILIFDMLAGRLELFPVLILFHPVVWKDFFSHKKKHKGRA